MSYAISLLMENLLFVNSMEWLEAARHKKTNLLKKEKRCKKDEVHNLFFPLHIKLNILLFSLILVYHLISE